MRSGRASFVVSRFRTAREAKFGSNVLDAKNGLTRPALLATNIMNATTVYQILIKFDQLNLISCSYIILA